MSTFDTLILKPSSREQMVQPKIGPTGPVTLKIRTASPRPLKGAVMLKNADNANNKQRGHRSLHGGGGSSLWSPPIKGRRQCGHLHRLRQLNVLVSFSFRLEDDVVCLQYDDSICN